MFAHLQPVVAAALVCKRCILTALLLTVACLGEKVTGGLRGRGKLQGLRGLGQRIFRDCNLAIFQICKWWK